MTLATASDLTQWLNEVVAIATAEATGKTAIAKLWLLSERGISEVSLPSNLDGQLMALRRLACQKPPLAGALVQEAWLKEFQPGESAQAGQQADHYPDAREVVLIQVRDFEESRWATIPISRDSKGFMVLGEVNLVEFEARSLLDFLFDAFEV